MGKRKRRKQAQERRRRELERLQETIEEQRAAAPSSPPTPPPPSEPPSPSPLPDEEAVELEEDRLWTRFEKADLEGKQALFLSKLEAGELDDEYAFQMLSDIRSKLDLRDPQARAHYAELVGQLRQQAPDLYEHSILFYHKHLIHDAVTDGRWEALPELLAPFADKLDLDLFDLVIDRLLYHGQIQPLIQVMTHAWPQVSESADLLPWAIDEFAGRLMHLNLFDYLETAESPRADDPALLEATTPYGEWEEGWLERFIPRLTKPAPSGWQTADFGPAVDADQWHDNLNNLLAEFVADQHRVGVPYSRGYMAWTQLAEALHRQFTSPAAPKRRRGSRGRAKSRRAVPASPLVPRYQTMDKVLADLFPLLGARPCTAAAVQELLPAYLHFLARLGLIHPTDMDAALAELQPLKKHGPRVLESYGADPRAVDAVAAAWSEEALNALRDDPALAEARATPPEAPPPPAEKPSPQPGALLTYTFRVTYLRDPDVWRTIEIAEDQSLDDLHYAIQHAVHFAADHLYSFYMSGRAWDEDTEYAHSEADGPGAGRVRIRDLNLRMKQRFLYLFDYGDEHRFEVQLVDVNPNAPKGDYPRVVQRHGKNPPQYPGWDDEWEEDEDWEDQG